jgi:hypothetical protein
VIEKPKMYYSTAGILALLILASSFLNTDLFKAGFQNFSVWFVLSMFSFACGWLINKTLGYNHGGKIVFAVVVASSLVSIVMISYFNVFFGFSYLLVESMILYILRNITLGAMAFFGMALSEVIILQKEVARKPKENDFQKIAETGQREVQLIIDEAKLKADKMIYEAQQRVDDLIERKSQIERRLKEFVATERELIKNYEAEEE